MNAKLGFGIGLVVLGAAVVSNIYKRNKNEKVAAELEEARREADARVDRAAKKAADATSEYFKTTEELLRKLKEKEEKFRKLKEESDKLEKEIKSKDKEIENMKKTFAENVLNAANDKKEEK